MSKSLALLGVLLAVEIAFLAVLTFFLEQAEADLTRETMARRIVFQSTALTKSLYQTLSTAYLCKRVRDDSYREVFDRGCTSIGEQLRSLKMLLPEASLTAAEKTRLDSAMKDTSEFIAALRSLLNEDVTSSYEFLGDVAAADLLNRKCMKLLYEIDAITEEKNKLLRESENKTLVRSWVRPWLRFGILLNVLMAIVLGVLFARGITKRLAVILDNTARLSNNEKLNDRLGGRDEIAQLDSDFHDMAEKLSELEELQRTFIAMYSHDLRTPMSSIRATLDLLGTGVWGPIEDKAKVQVARAEQACDEGVRMLTSMLDYEKLRSGTLEMEFAPTNLRSLVDRSLASVAGLLLQKEIESRLVFSSNDTEIRADQNWLTQVLINLLTNAIKFSPKNTTITVTVEQTREAARVSISDQGEGISKEDQQKIFDRFQQATGSTRRVQGGYGLGLFVCRSVIEEHGGKIGVDSEEGEGSTFWFELPMVSEKTSSAAKESY